MPNDDKLNPDELLNEDEGEEEEVELGEFMAGMLNEFADTGIPVRFIATAADPFVHPVLRRIEHQNRILHDISVTLRAIAQKQGASLPPQTITAELPKKPKQ